MRQCGRGGRGEKWEGGRKVGRSVVKSGVSISVRILSSLGRAPEAKLTLAEASRPAVTSTSRVG